MVHIRPRIVIAALKGGSGKTIISLGLAGAWREKGLRVAPFKKGPDFIDAGWLAFSAGRPCHNLDPFLMNGQQVVRSFIRNSADSDMSLIEGNRGLYDGMDVEGSCSTAELARLLRARVILIVDVTMSTRTVAAVVKGCQVFDPELQVAAVILNRVAGPRQERLIRDTVEAYCGVPVVGSVPKLKENLFPERHMGLVPYQERVQAEKAVAWTRRIVTDHLDLERIWKIGESVDGLPAPHEATLEGPPPIPWEDELRIGIVQDSAFWFYYPENLEELERQGAKLIRLNALCDPDLPPLHALYIGGGFPETQAPGLAENARFRKSLRAAIQDGLPVYAECGGLMYLGEELHVGGNRFPMAGALPVSFTLSSRPQGHGYTILEAVRPNPFYAVGERLKGHEFHYSRPQPTEPGGLDFVFRVKRGHGMDGTGDGICSGNLLAMYTHIHAGGSPWWAGRLLHAAQEFRMKSKFFLQRSKITVDNRIALQ